MRCLVGIGFAATLMLAACSGSAGGDGGSAAGQANDQAGASSPAGASAAEAATSSAREGASTTPAASTPDGGLVGVPAEKQTARVTIGDASYEFSNLFCITLGGMIGAESSVSVGDNDTFELNLPPAGDQGDFDPPSVHVVVADLEQDWIAGDPDIDLPVGQSQVDSYTIDGRHASGTATFLNANTWLTGQGEGVAGTFAVNCDG